MGKPLKILHIITDTLSVKIEKSVF